MRSTSNEAFSDTAQKARVGAMQSGGDELDLHGAGRVIVSFYVS
jgi:hypothetical protein